MAKQKALIVGAGIGGLTLSLCLADSGFDVVIFEQTSQIGEVGAGLQLSPNCSRVLHYLGLEEALQAAAFLPEAVEVRDWKQGKLLSTTTLGKDALKNYGFPYYHIHRADLLAMLLDKARDHPKIKIEHSARIEGFEESLKSCSIVHDGKTIYGDMIIGADGIHSAIRTTLFGQEEPVFTGNVAWRGLIPIERLAGLSLPPVAGLWWGPGKHFVHYYVRRGELVNCVCVVEKPGWEVESWTQKGDLDELRQDFIGWDKTIVSLIDAMEPDKCFQWALFDREPMPYLSRGSVALLGDACHPTLPFLAQGAAMAIEDAAVLSACVEVEGIDIGLRQYQDQRMSRTARIQNTSRRNAKIFHMGGLAARARNQAVNVAAKNVLDWVYRYDPLAPIV